MWFSSELPSKREVKCQVVYFCLIFLSRNNTEFTASDLCSVTSVEVLCRSPLAFHKWQVPGKEELNVLTVVSKQNTRQKLTATAALYSREIKTVLVSSHTPPSFKCCFIIDERQDGKLHKRHLGKKKSSFLIISFHLLTRRKPACWCQQSNTGLCSHTVLRYRIQVLYIKVSGTAKGLCFTL